MPRPSRPGQTSGQTGHRASVDLGSMFGGAASPTNIGTDLNPDAGVTDVPTDETEKGAPENTRARVTPKPAQVIIGEKPNSFLNFMSGGKLGAAYNQQALEAAKFNAGASNDLMAQQVNNAALLERGKTIQELVNKGQVDIHTLDDNNKLALAHAVAEEDRKTAAAAIDNTLMGKNGLPTSQLEAFTSKVSPQVLNNLLAAAKGQGTQLGVDNNIFASPEFAATRKTGMLAQNIAPQVANNKNALEVHQGDSAFVPNPDGSTTMYKGGIPGGSTTEDIQITTPTSIKHITTAKPVTGTPAAMQTLGAKIPLVDPAGINRFSPNITAKPTNPFAASFQMTNAGGNMGVSPKPVSSFPSTAQPQQSQQLYPLDGHPEIMIDANGMAYQNGQPAPNLTPYLKDSIDKQLQSISTENEANNIFKLRAKPVATVGNNYINFPQ